MTVHRRVLATGAEPIALDAFAVKIAGRHTYDRASHGYVRFDEVDGPSLLTQVARAYQDVYPVPAQPAVRANPDAPTARSALQAAGGDDFTHAFADTVGSAFDIDVIRVDGVDGDFALEVAGRAVIVVGATPNWFFQNWSLAHELGHILRGDLTEPTKVVVSSRTIERAANAFAAELLLPRALLDGMDWMDTDESALADFVWRAGVSTRALASRLRSLKIEVSPSTRALLGTATKSLVKRGSVVAAHPDGLAQRLASSASARFPADLVDAHLAAVAEGAIASTSLEWMLAAGS